MPNRKRNSVALSSKISILSFYKNILCCSKGMESNLARLLHSFISFLAQLQDFNSEGFNAFIYFIYIILRYGYIAPKSVDAADGLSGASVTLPATDNMSIVSRTGDDGSSLRIHNEDSHYGVVLLLLLSVL